MNKQVLVPIADGVEEIEAVTIIDVLRRAGAQVTVAAVGDTAVTASRGVRLVADVRIADCMHRTYDLIVLPGGIPGAEHLRDCPELVELLRTQKKENRWYGAICAAPAVALEPHGLLVGTAATAHPGFISRLAADRTRTDPVVKDGRCVTSRGPGTAMAFALTLVAALFGPDTARSVAEAMVADPVVLGTIL